MRWFGIAGLPNDVQSRDRPFDFTTPTFDGTTTMTERWISTKKYYCKYCNTWIPDTKISRQQHDITDRHKNAMQRNLSRIQRQDAINRSSNPTLAPPTAAAASSANMRNKVVNTAAYGYGERDDMTAFLAKGKKTKYEIPEQEEIVPLKAREGNVGKWEVTQILSKEEDKEGVDDGVKKEESPDLEEIAVNETTKRNGLDGERKRERAKTPDQEDLVRFRVEEKVFPTDIKGEDDEAKVPTVGFKKRKIGNKSSRVSGTL